MSARPVRVLVADDQAAVRDGLVTILEHEPDVEVVGSALGERRTHRAIAESLHVPVATVKSHANNPFGKLRVGNRAEAAALVERVRDHGL
ncbi:response regulator transcription factor [Streptomyces sp. x-19]|uniref:response regulator transcription factor n=1 Tax=Streptomyces sp. x-19 TaxID=2789280 RepID=UPI0039816A8B